MKNYKKYLEFINEDVNNDKFEAEIDKNLIEMKRLSYNLKNGLNQIININNRTDEDVKRISDENLTKMQKDDSDDKKKRTDSNDKQKRETKMKKLSFYLANIKEILVNINKDKNFNKDINSLMNLTKKVKIDDNYTNLYKSTIDNINSKNKQQEIKNYVDTKNREIDKENNDIKNANNDPKNAKKVKIEYKPKLISYNNLVAYINKILKLGDIKKNGDAKNDTQHDKVKIYKTDISGTYKTATGVIITDPDLNNYEIVDKETKPVV